MAECDDSEASSGFLRSIFFPMISKQIYGRLFAMDIRYNDDNPQKV